MVIIEDTFECVVHCPNVHLCYTLIYVYVNEQCVGYHFYFLYPNTWRMMMR